MKASCAVVLCAFTAACESGGNALTSPNCGDVGVPAITVVALDDFTLQPVNARGLLVVSDGQRVDTVNATGSTPPVYAMGYNQPGTYAITLDVAGYRTWHIEGVVARRGTCNVETVPLAAYLTPASTGS